MINVRLNSYSKDYSIIGLDISHINKIANILYKNMGFDGDTFCKIIKTGNDNIKDNISKCNIEYYGIKFHILLEYLNIDQLKEVFKKIKLRSSSYWWKIEIDEIKKYSFVKDKEKIYLFYEFGSKNKVSEIFLGASILKSQIDKKIINIDKIFDISSNFIELLYENKLDWFINTHDVYNKIKCNKLYNKIECNELYNRIGQIYLKNKAEDKYAIKLFNESSRSNYTIKDLLSNGNTDLEYIINGIKYFNLNNLKVLSNHFGYKLENKYNYKTFRYTNDYLGPKIEKNDFNNKIMKSLTIKFSKYVLDNDKKEANFIREYYK